MPNEEVNETNQPTEVTESEKPESSQASGTIEPVEPHRYSEVDAPYTWAVGKTDREVMDVANQMMESMKTWEKPVGNPTVTTGQPVQYNPNVAAVNYGDTAAGPVMPDPDAYLGDSPGYQRAMAAYLDSRDENQAKRIAEQMQATLQPQIATLGTMARDSVARDPEFERIFSRFGHEDRETRSCY